MVERCAIVYLCVGVFSQTKLGPFELLAFRISARDGFTGLRDRSLSALGATCNIEFLDLAESVVPLATALVGVKVSAAAAAVAMATAFADS